MLIYVFSRFLMVLAHCNTKIATVAGQWGDMARASGDFADECDRMSNQTRRSNFVRNLGAPYINT